MRFIQFVWTDQQLIAAAPSGLVNLGDPTAQPVAFAPMMGFAPASDGRIIGMTASKQIAVIDIKNGLSYLLPGPPNSMVETVRGDGSSIAIRRAGPRTVFRIYDLQVPMEPAALRTWLELVTNARPIGDTDVVSWP